MDEEHAMPFTSHARLVAEPHDKKHQHKEGEHDEYSYAVHGEYDWLSSLHVLAVDCGGCRQQLGGAIVRVVRPVVRHGPQPPVAFRQAEVVCGVVAPGRRLTLAHA